MGFENGVGFKVVKTLPTKPTTKSYIKVKQATDLNLKNYMNVKETVGVSKDYTEVMLVDYDYPKDYLLVNYLGTESYHTFDGVDDYLNLGVLSDRGTVNIQLTFVTNVSDVSQALFGCRYSKGIYVSTDVDNSNTLLVSLPKGDGGYQMRTAIFSSSLDDGRPKTLNLNRVSQYEINVDVNGETIILTFDTVIATTFDGAFWVGASLSGGLDKNFSGKIYNISVDGVAYPVEDLLVNG